MDQKLYEKFAGFVPLLASSVLELAAIKPGNKVLDLGCGDGVLTRRIQDEVLDAAQGGQLVGIDPQEDMIAAARRNGVRDVRQASLAQLSDLPDLQQADFDIVFTNATLHWVPDLVAAPANRPDPLQNVYRALKPGGAFVGDFGGFGNMSDVAPVMTAAVAFELAHLRGTDAASMTREVAKQAWPWYFPTDEVWRQRLEATGLFDVESVELQHRPTTLVTTPADWCKTFGSRWRACLPKDEVGDAAWERALQVVDAALQNSAFESGTQTWQLQYKRCRFRAVKKVV